MLWTIPCKSFSVITGLNFFLVDVTWLCLGLSGCPCCTYDFASLIRSFAGVPVKDKSRCAMPILSTYIPSARTVPSDLDASTTMPE